MINIAIYNALMPNPISSKIQVKNAEKFIEEKENKNRWNLSYNYRK